jgi:hypothetical protein
VAEEWRENGKPIVVSPDTVWRCLDGGRTHSQFNSEINAWLIPEKNSIIEYYLVLAKRGFPLNHKHLKFHIDSLLQVQLGDSFPKKGVGKSWTDCFIEWYSACLSCYWSSLLDTAHGCAVNPNTNAKWYNLLGNTIKEKGIEHDCIWAADKSRFQPGKGLKECVIDPTAQKNQYQ